MPSIVHMHGLEYTQKLDVMNYMYITHEALAIINRINSIFKTYVTLIKRKRDDFKLFF